MFGRLGVLPMCRAGEPYYSDGGGGYYNDSQGSCEAPGGTPGLLPPCNPNEQRFSDGGGGFYTDSQGSCTVEYPTGGGFSLDGTTLALIGGIGALILVLSLSGGGSSRRRR